MSAEDPYVQYLWGEVYYAQDKIDRATRAWNRSLQWASDPKVKSHAQQRLDRAVREADAQKALGQLASQHFILRYDQQVADYTLGQNILDHLEGLYARLAFKLFGSPPQTITVILYTREGFFDITRAPNWSGALYDGKIKVPVKGLTEVSEKLSAVLVHELAHAFIALATRRNCPAWLNEGIAQWSEGRGITTEQQRYLAQLHRQKALLPLRQLEESFVSLSASTAVVAYLEALSAVEFLVRLGHSESVLKAVLEQLRSGAGFDDALKQTIRSGTEQFEKTWTDYLVADY